MSNTYSGKKAIKILCRHFGFYLVSQKGSHVKLRTKKNNKTITTIIPTHRELAKGTLEGILELAGVDQNEFQKFI
jgi:predicted RNA binding protein YcfA (HicA-like mRNA interferase family)